MTLMTLILMKELTHITGIRAWIREGACLHPVTQTWAWTHTCRAWVAMQSQQGFRRKGKRSTYAVGSSKSSLWASREELSELVTLQCLIRCVLAAITWISKILTSRLIHPSTLWLPVTCNQGPSMIKMEYARNLILLEDKTGKYIL